MAASAASNEETNTGNSESSQQPSARAQPVLDVREAIEHSLPHTTGHFGREVIIMIVFSYSLYLLFIFAFGVMQSLDKEKELKEAIQIRKKLDEGSSKFECVISTRRRCNKLCNCRKFKSPKVNIK
ncbi:hypothetical protein Tcan_17975 [Toxocara canis]|uniref:Uncharacterized protein n=1 Tax=Toxocara canis TaxID=6265 RepID=A0A0B2VRU3_TOXCA|nr:hypothetical protein Tcan_17975 [Toxocara canis]